MLLSKVTYTNTYIHTVMAVAGKVQFGVQYLAQGHFDMQLGESNQRSSDNKTLALPLSHSSLAVL